MTDWPEPSYSLGPRDHIHAVGAIAITSNKLELIIQRYFMLYTSIPLTAGIRLFAKLNNEVRTSTIRDGLGESGHTPQIKDRVEHLLKAYAAIMGSRNILMHSTADTIQFSDEDIPSIVFRKAPKGNQLSLNLYYPPIELLRSISDSAHAFTEYGDALHSHILKKYGPHFYGHLPTINQGRVYALPDKPPLPPLLIPDYP